MELFLFYAGVLVLCIVAYAAGKGLVESFKETDEKK